MQLRNPKGCDSSVAMTESSDKKRIYSPVFSCYRPEFSNASNADFSENKSKDAP